MEKLAKNAPQNRAQQRLKANQKRSKKLTELKRQNMKLAKQIEAYTKHVELTPEQAEMSKALVYALKHCSNYSLYGYCNDHIELITNLPCRNKLCFICNWQRQKSIRRKYNRFFGDNAELLEVVKNGKSKITTKSQAEKYIDKGFDVLPDRVSYDLMHLTLTIPHTSEGFNGKRFYFREIIRAFNFMRKTNEWLELVYGGEYGVESTRNQDGYHIHIHALLFVKSQRKNRNTLHRAILKIWNRLTINNLSTREAFTDEEKEAILKGNNMLTMADVNALNPKGATFINLESIYYIENGRKIYGMVNHRRISEESLMKAVMETISYHFKPKMFQLRKENPDGSYYVSDNFYDIASIVELSPEIYRQQLYNKFGCLQGEKSLNIKDDSVISEYDEVTADFDVDEETGELLGRQFFITNPLNVYAGKDDAITLLRKVRGIVYLKEESGRGAVEKLYENYVRKKTGNSPIKPLKPISYE